MWSGLAMWLVLFVLPRIDWAKGIEQVWSGMCKQGQVKHLEVGKWEVTTLWGHLHLIEQSSRMC